MLILVFSSSRIYTNLSRLSPPAKLFCPRDKSVKFKFFVDPFSSAAVIISHIDILCFLVSPSLYIYFLSYYYIRAVTITMSHTQLSSLANYLRFSFDMFITISMISTSFFLNFLSPISRSSIVLIKIKLCVFFLFFSFPLDFWTAVLLFPLRFLPSMLFSDHGF